MKRTAFCYFSAKIGVSNKLKSSNLFIKEENFKTRALADNWINSQYGHLQALGLSNDHDYHVFRDVKEIYITYFDEGDEE